jgi:hypothetical protein
VNKKHAKRAFLYQREKNVTANLSVTCAQMRGGHLSEWRGNVSVYVSVYALMRL